jgi:hypothetical protein
MFTDVLEMLAASIIRAIENRVLRRIFGPKRYVVTGQWRKIS